jgi:hypothetical protein
MAENMRKPPRNRDLELPRQTGETMQSTTPPERGGERERNAPLPEEEAYERQAARRRRRDGNQS